MEEEREKVLRFANAMLIELDHNNHKGSILLWEGLAEKVAELEYHKAKLMMALKHRNSDAIREYIADCANILLSIGNGFGIYDKPIVQTNQVTRMKRDIFESVDLGESQSGVIFNMFNHK